MFFELVSRNSKRNRKGNGLFFSSLVITIIAFYLILSLSHQDVMLFLAKMESDAVNKLLAMIPLFYGMTLIILFFLIYFASKYQFESKKHEFGMYLMLGMRRYRLFFLLLMEDTRNSLVSLVTGLPVAIVISELISLITAKLVGLGLVGHTLSVSLRAIVLTAVGFITIKFAAFLILSGKIARQEIGKLLVEKAEGSRKQKPFIVYALSLGGGAILLAAAYTMAIVGISWYSIRNMALTLLFGLSGTFLVFFGLRSMMSSLAGKRDKGYKLHTFTFRQLQEAVIHKSSSMAVSSLLILAALCCFGGGVAIAAHYGDSGQRTMEYTFVNYEDSKDVRAVLRSKGADKFFSDIFDIKLGNVYTGDMYPDSEYEEEGQTIYNMRSVMELLSEMPDSEEKRALEDSLSHVRSPYLLSLSGYNTLLSLGGHREVHLAQDEAAVYRGLDVSDTEGIRMLNKIFEARPQVQILGEPFYLTGDTQTTEIVVDRAITLDFALIVQDDVFERLTKGRDETYTNAVLAREQTEGKSLMSVMMSVNEELNQTGLTYESYLQNMGRQLFYIVAASYITIYLAIVFLIIANTVIGVQFLTQIQRAKGRYKTLIRIGASYKALCHSAGKQINWYFGIPVIVAAMSSIFGARALFTGVLSEQTDLDMKTLLFMAIAMIVVLCVVEYIYMRVVKRFGNRYLLTLMTPEREE